MESHSVYKVFTPTTPARLAFVEREEVNSKLVSALRTPGKQIVVYGHSGSGKTTLLINKLHQLYETHLTSRCMKGLTFEALLLDAFDQLSPYYSSEKTQVIKNGYAVNISQDYLHIKSQINAIKEEQVGQKSVRILPPQLTPQALGKFIGEAKGCWVLEDFHKIDVTEREKLSQIMKVFMDMADEYPTLKAIAIGAVDTARQVVEYDLEMKNRVAEIHVPLMSNKEIQEIITKGGQILKVNFEKDLVHGVSSYSSGMASVCHHLCLNICTSQNIIETQKENIEIETKSLNDALKVYLDESSDTLKKAFDIAFKQQRTKKYDNNRLIIKALSELSPEGALRSEIHEKISKNEKDYPQGNLTRFLDQLCNEKEVAIIRKDNTSGRYSFSDPIYRVFALAYFKDNDPKNYGGKKNFQVSFEIFFKEFEGDFKEKLKDSLKKEIKIKGGKDD